jgi:nitrogen fixation NifU-like protein
MKSAKALYSQQVLDHFHNPRNMGEMKDPDGVGTVGNPVCGDVNRIFIKVAKRAGQEVIEDVKFQTLGCGAAIATSSMATEMIKGQPLAKAQELTNQAITEALGGLPLAKRHCSVLAADAVKKAIEDYRQKATKES